MKLSTGFRNGLMGTESAKDLLDGSVVRVYSGTPPASANDAVPGGAVLLCEYSVDGDGTPVTFEGTVTNGTLFKNSSEVWEGDALATGNPAFFRMVKPADGGGSSTTAVRVQGTAGAGNSELQTASPSMTLGAPQKINYFYLVLPEGS